MSKKNKQKKQKQTEIKVFQQFKKQQIFKQISFVFAALILGFGINSFVLDGNFGNNLKANILEKSNNKIDKKADIFIEKTKGDKSNLMKLITGKQIDELKNISFSFTYNPDEIEILDVFPSINTTRIENQKGITTFIINFKKAKTFKNKEEIINFYVSKKSDKVQNINLINANFVDKTGKKYDLTTSGITF